MKNFDFPYLNDSPLDLSGIEGAPRSWVCDDCGADVEADDEHECEESER